MAAPTSKELKVAIATAIITVMGALVTERTTMHHPQESSATDEIAGRLSRIETDMAVLRTEMGIVKGEVLRLRDQRSR